MRALRHAVKTRHGQLTTLRCQELVGKHKQAVYFTNGLCWKRRFACTCFSCIGSTQHFCDSFTVITSTVITASGRRPHHRRRRTVQSYSPGGTNVPTWSPMWAHWRHLENTIELMLPSAHPSPQPKWQIDRFSHFCTLTAQSLYTLQNCPSHGGIWNPI